MLKFKRPIQIVFSLLVFMIAAYVPNGLLYVLLASVVLGAVFGKIFCKWMCPMGLIKGIMMQNMSEDQQKSHMFNYYKVGCPISWIQGFLNKYSLFKIRKDDACISCGKCDKVCYIPTFDQTKSVYKDKKQKAHEAFNCSKCLKCVETCPVNSLKYSFK